MHCSGCRRADSAFRDKLARIGNELRKLGESAARVGLVPINAQSSALDSRLQALQTQPVLSGDDFLQLPPALDALFNLIGSASRLAEQRSGRLGIDSAQRVPAAKLRSPGTKHWPRSFTSWSVIWATNWASPHN
jgi:hypothetical protein